MLAIASVVERAREAFASVSRLEEALSHAPDDPAIQINLSARRKLAQQAGEQLRAISARNKIEVCNYRLVPQEDKYGLLYVSKSMFNYQNMFSQIYDAKKHGAKGKAVIGKEVLAESALEFGYSYSGSLGVVLLAQSSRDFFTGKFDDSIDALYQVLEISDQHDVRDLAHSLGNAVVKRVHDWTESNVEGGFSADVRWSRSDGRELGQVIDQKKMSSIVQIIDAASDKVTEDIEVEGVLVGVDLKSRTFHFVVPNGPDYRGKLSAEFRENVVPVGHAYVAYIAKTSLTKYATEQVETSYQLRRLEPTTKEMFSA